MAPSTQRTTPDRPVARLVGSLLIFAIILVALAVTFFVARGFNQYREALAALPLDEMEQRIESASGFTPSLRVRCACRTAGGSPKRPRALRPA